MLYKNLLIFLTDSPSMGRYSGIFNNSLNPLAGKNYNSSSFFSYKLSTILMMIDCLFSKNKTGLSIISRNILVIYWTGMSSVYSFLRYQIELPPEHFCKFVFMHFSQAVITMRMCRKSPRFSHVYPRNSIHSTVNLFIGRYVINNFNTLQVLIILNVISHDVLITEKLQQWDMHFHLFNKLAVHLRFEQFNKVN